MKILGNNHVFTVEEKSKPNNALVTDLILFDQTLEGIEPLDHLAFWLKYHPEIAPNSREYL